MMTIGLTCVAALCVGFMMTDVSKPGAKKRVARPKKTVEWKDGVLVSSFHGKK
jgi:hypothetical protein